MVAKTKVRDTGYVSAHRTKKAAERQAKLFGEYAKVIRTPKHLQKMLKGKPYIVKIS